jgi:hypothetical protein
LINGSISFWGIFDLGMEHPIAAFVPSDAAKVIWGQISSQNKISSDETAGISTLVGSDIGHLNTMDRFFWAVNRNRDALVNL